MLKEKLIDFEGGQILGVKDENEKVWLGVRKACIDIGLSTGQADRQVTNLKNDIVLNKGLANLQLLSNGGKQITLVFFKYG